MEAVAALRRRRRPGGRDLQRLPGADRGRPAARGAAEEPAACASCARTVGVRGRRRHRSVLTAGPAVGHRAARSRSTTSSGSYVCDERHPRRAAGRGPGGAALRGQPERLGRRHRRDRQRRRATWSASCPTPSGPSTTCSARPTGWCCSVRCSGATGRRPRPERPAPPATQPRARAMPAFWSTAALHAGRSPGAVADALALAVGLGHLHELLLQAAQVLDLAGPGQLLLEVLLLLHRGAGGSAARPSASCGVDGGQPLLDRGRRPLAGRAGGWRTRGPRDSGGRPGPPRGPWPGPPCARRS